MKSRHRPSLLMLLSLAAVFHGCNCAHTRQIVYPSRARAPIQADSSPGDRVKRPPGKVRLPDRNLDAAPRRVDVPMMQPE